MSYHKAKFLTLAVFFFVSGWALLIYYMMGGGKYE